MKCPNCEVELLMAERQKVEIDYCQRCRGVWLDRGELDKIIERACDEQTVPALPRQHAEGQEDRHTRREREDQKERPKPPWKTSFLRDLFDF